MTHTQVCYMCYGAWKAYMLIRLWSVTFIKWECFFGTLFGTNWMRTWGILKEWNDSLLWNFCAPWAINSLMWGTLKMTVCARHSYEIIMVQNYSKFDSRCLNHACFKQVSQNIHIFVVFCFWKGTISFERIKHFVKQVMRMDVDGLMFILCIIRHIKRD
jgi:hypothetical protein